MDNFYEGGGRIEMDYTYTPWRKFLAWTGIVFIVLILAGMVLATIFVNANV